MQARLKILVIDDDSDMRQTLMDVLQKNGHEVDVAEDGIGALNKLWTYTYDLALTDIMMPGISGLRVMSTARYITQKVDFLVISGNDSAENREEAFRLGAKGFLRKPFTPQELLSVVKAIKSGTADDTLKTAKNE